MKASAGGWAAYYSYDLLARESAWKRALQLVTKLPDAKVEAEDRRIRFPNGGRIDFVIGAVELTL